MAYTLQLGDQAPNFENLLSTEGQLYGVKDINNKSFKFVSGKNDLIKSLISKFPNEKNGIYKYFNLLENINSKYFYILKIIKKN
mgnify:CR=1 FL=1